MRKHFVSRDRARVRLVLSAAAWLSVLALPLSAQAEVLDKVPSLGAIWCWALLGSVVGALLWQVRWWLGLACGLLAGRYLTGLWAELTDPFVGPALWSEAGPQYYWLALAATLTVAASHGGAAWHAYRRHQRNRAAAGR